MATTRPNEDFDRAAAVTRSLLGYGVIAGPIYLLVGLIEAFTRDGFDLTRHSLSLLANGSMGWVHVLNLVVSGLMVLAAALGVGRTPDGPRAAAILLGGYGLGLILGGIFVADPMDGFPRGAPAGMPAEPSVSGLLHLAAGGIGFLSLAAAFLVLGSRFTRRGERRAAVGSRVSATVMIVSFVAGAAVPAATVGLLWLTVLTGWAWLAVVSVLLYRTVPHPDVHRRG